MYFQTYFSIRVLYNGHYILSDLLNLRGHIQASFKQGIILFMQHVYSDNKTKYNLFCLKA